MTITVASGVSSSGLTISGGDPLVVRSGGTVSSSTVLSGGSATLSAGAIGDVLTVSSGGFLRGAGDLEGASTVAGTVSGVTVAGEGALELKSGGIASGVIISGTFQIDPGATASGTVIDNEAQVYGSALGGTVASGGDEIVNAGASVSGGAVQSGGLLVMEQGATASDETVLSGGELTYLGSLNSSFTLQASPLASAEVLEGVTVSAGGTIVLENAAVLSGATLTVAEGVDVFGLTISKGGAVAGAGVLFDNVNDTGAISGVTLAGGDNELVVRAGGAANGVTILASSTAQINSGATATGLILSDGLGRVFGAASGTLVDGGGSEIVYSGGVGSGDSVQSLSKELVSSGGRAVSAAISAGGALDVMAAGVTTGTLVSSGGKELIKSGGVASATSVLSGGETYVYSGGEAIKAVIAGRSVDTVFSGGVANGLTVSSGGKLIDDGQVRIAGAGTLAGVLSGSGAIVQTKAGDLLLSGTGAAFTGRAVISGGTIELATSGAIGAGSVVFVAPSTGSAVLQIDAADAPAAGGTFANVISNFSGANEDIDLRSIAYVAGATATVTGSTLTLTEGGQTYAFKLAGSIGASFPVISDGHGGTLIDPKGLSPQVAVFAQAAAAFAPSDAANTVFVSSGASSSLTPLVHAAGSAGGLAAR